MKNRTAMLKELTHTINMMESHSMMTIACDGAFIRMLKDARDIIKELTERAKPQQIEMEGGGSTWWYVCPECHGPIDSKDHFCRHCGQAVED